jgi:hypothetical protein
VNKKRPPLGLRPRFVALMDRLREIDKAIQRYLDAEYSIPQSWMDERNNIIQELRSMEEKRTKRLT